MENYERDPVNFFRSDPCPAAFAAAVPKNHLPPGAVRPVGAGGAAAAGAGQPARHGAQRPDGGGIRDGPDHPPRPHVTPYRETIVSAPPGVFQTALIRPSVDTATEDSTVTFTDGKNVTHSIEYKSQIPLTPVLKAVWHTGMYVMAAWFLLANLRFMLHLRRSRKPYPWKLPLSGVSDGGSAPPLSVRPVSPRHLPHPRRRGIPGDPAACSDPRDHPRPPSGPPVEPAAVRVSSGVLVRPAGVDRRHRLPPGLRAGL